MLVSDFHVVLMVKFDIPPGTSRENAAKMLSQGGVNVPLGLLQYVRRVDVNVVDGSVDTGELGGKPKLI